MTTAGSFRAVRAACSLPGIGRSTAGAILALALGARFPILDGNARRVLARYFGVGNSSDGGVAQRLWSCRSAAPAPQVDAYTSDHDLGATVCVRRKPCALTARCR